MSTQTHTHEHSHTKKKTLNNVLDFFLVLGSVFSFSQAMAGGGLGQSLKKALLVLLVLLACSRKPARGSTVGKAVVLVASLATKPVRGFPTEWWRIRVWEGKFYYIYRSGFYEELQQWEEESLQEAFTTEPEMAVFRTGQSQMHWGQVPEWPPYWNVESQQWSALTRTPHTHMH